MIRRITVFMVGLSTGMTFAADPTVRPGLLAAYTEFTERPQTTTVYRIDAVPGIALRPGESPVLQRASISRVTWTGTINILTSGDYRFYSVLQGAQLNLSIGAVGETSISVRAEAFEAESIATSEKKALRAGTYPISITWDIPKRQNQIFDSQKNPRHLSLLWEGPGFRIEPIPATVFRHVGEKEIRPSHGDLRILERGQFLIREHSCLTCHQPKGSAEPAPVKNGPILIDIGRRVNAGWLDAWLADPTKLRPHTTMPKLFTDDDHGRAERYAVTMYLASLGGPIRDREPRIEPAAAKRGKSLFLSTGCAACHANTPNAATTKRHEDDDPAPTYDPKNSILGMGSPTGPQATYVLGAVGSKMSIATLANYLIDPLKSNPHGRMPNMTLSANEARDIAVHLASMKDNLIPNEPAKPTMKPDGLAASKSINGFETLDDVKQWLEVGKRLMTSKGCVNCHTVASPELPARSRPVTDFRGDTGCVKDQDLAKHPVFTLTPADRNAIQTALMINSFPLSAKPDSSFEARYRLTRLMCLNCHERDGEGGLSAALADEMKSIASTDNADDVRPPTLTQIGHKATAAWLNEVLLNKGRARPWMGLRMPQYGSDNVGGMVHGLSALDAAVPQTTALKPSFDSNLVKSGRLLTGKEGYGCITCHDISGVVGGGTRGPDLAKTTQRIRPDWFARWMHNPQRIQPGTKMPQYFLDGKATHPALGANPDQQIVALRAYYDLGPGLPLPSGIEAPKGLTVTVKNGQTEILRTFMPDGAGTRSFAVGFPGGTNLAFDGTKARISYLWSGPFLDATPVWAGRGGQPAKLLGPKIWAAPEGRAWASTGVGETPDFGMDDQSPEQSTTELPTVRFNGYSRDANGNPTFRSDVKGIRVEELLSPMTNDLAVGITRTVTVTVPENQIGWFRPANGVSGERLKTDLIKLITPDGKAVILRLRDAASGTAWEPIDRDRPAEARLRFPSGRTTVSIQQWILPKDDQSLIDALK